MITQSHYESFHYTVGELLPATFLNGNLRVNTCLPVTIQSNAMPSHILLETQQD